MPLEGWDTSFPIALLSRHFSADPLLITTFRSVRGEYQRNSHVQARLPQTPVNGFQRPSNPSTSEDEPFQFLQPMLSGVLGTLDDLFVLRLFAAFAVVNLQPDERYRQVFVELRSTTICSLRNEERPFGVDFLKCFKAS